MDEQIKIQYFRHQANAQKDEKIIQLLRKEKWQGYGIYWALLEFLTPIKDHKAKADYDAIAWDLRVDEQTVKHIVEDYGLFVVQKGYFWSESLTAQLDETVENIKRKKAAASIAGRSSAERRRARNDIANNRSTDVEKNATNVATNVAPSINNIDTIDAIDKKDKRDDISIPSNEATDTSSSSLSDDATTSFDIRINDRKFLAIVSNYMHKGASRPTEEAVHLIDMFAPNWKTKDGRSFLGHEEDACQFWNVPRERKYITVPRLSVNDCRMANSFLSLVLEAKIFDSNVIDAYRGMKISEDKHVYLILANEAAATLIEKKYIKSFAAALRNMFGNFCKLEYKILQ